jgi:CDP-paratose 2-epimerase
MQNKSAIVVGGCGFIGTHCVTRLLDEGYKVLCVDNLSRPTARANLDWLMRIRRDSESLTFSCADIRHFEDLSAAFREHIRATGPVSLVAHQAAQVAVTTSVTSPRQDFENNALGTFNVLEAVRHLCPKATLIYSSTNKVYGGLEDVKVRETATRYEFENLPHGVPISQPLDLHSPYGCSKGAGDQYVRDYARIYNLRTFVFRQSCIYGTRQFGHEDQGWVSWFVIATLLRRPLTIYGNGKQMRDLLWIDDLLDAYWRAWQGPHSGGQIFNMGGGAGNTLSLLELLEILREIDPSLPPPAFAGTRPGDQPVYVSDIAATGAILGWEPKVAPREGVIRLWNWVKSNRSVIAAMVDPGRRKLRKAPLAAVAGSGGRTMSASFGT